MECNIEEKMDESENWKNLTTFTTGMFSFYDTTSLSLSSISILFFLVDVPFINGEYSSNENSLAFGSLSESGIVFDEGNSVSSILSIVSSNLKNQISLHLKH